MAGKRDIDKITAILGDELTSELSQAVVYYANATMAEYLTALGRERLCAGGVRPTERETWEDHAKTLRAQLGRVWRLGLRFGYHLGMPPEGESK